MKFSISLFNAYKTRSVELKFAKLLTEIPFVRLKNMQLMLENAIGHMPHSNLQLDSYKMIIFHSFHAHLYNMFDINVTD
jgi:hypothetical protein